MDKIFKTDIKLFIDSEFELDESKEKGWFITYDEIEKLFLLNDYLYDYDNLDKKSVIKYMIYNYDFLEKGFKRIEKINKRILKNIRIKE